MQSAVDVLLITASLALCIPVGMFCVEVACALFHRKAADVPRLAIGAQVAVVIPAHDEAAVIGATLRTLLPTLPPGSRTMVVADNCTDATAQIARQCGAQVIERCDA